jgi:cytochrome P450
MQTAIFLQSEVRDPYAIYANLPSIFWDDINHIWALYSYAHCKKILTHPAALIPAVNTDGLNDYARIITGGLARLSNGNDHINARETAMHLFQCMLPVSTVGILEHLIGKATTFDWVETVCKKLPVLSILNSFGFNKEEGDFITDHIHQLVRLMLPVKTEEQLISVNNISKEIYQIIENHLLKDARFINLSPELCISNLTGLIIQSFDAGRGLLSNALFNFQDKDPVQKSVIETLRFDSPIHNTRRIAGEDIIIDNHKIEKGQSILVVLAAANWDEQQFKDPGSYNIERNNNTSALTFGYGMHMCLAKQLSINMATEALQFLSSNKVSILQTQVEYEPLINARLPKELQISIDKA